MKVFNMNNPRVELAEPGEMNTTPKGLNKNRNTILE